MQKFSEQQEQIELVRSSMGPQDKGRLRNYDLAAKRAVSLPDMLSDEAGPGCTIGRARRIWIQQTQAKSSENLLI